MADFSGAPRAFATTITGTRGPENVVSGRVILDVAPEIAFYMPSASPLVAITSKMRGKRKTTQYQFDWLEKDEYPRSLVASVAIAAATTTLQVGSGESARLAANMVVMNVRTREHLLVTVVTSDTNITVVRGIGTAGVGIDIDAGDKLLITRSTFEDGSGKGAFKTVAENREYNYCEIIKTSYGFTGRQIETDLYGGKDVPIERKWAGIEHLKSIEYAMLFGKRHLRAGATHYQTFMGGAEYYINSNVWDVNGTSVSERSFVEFMEEAMRWGNGGNQAGQGTKYAFLSSRWLSEIEFWGKDKLQYRVLDSQLGLKAMEYNSAHGRIMLLHAPILDQMHPDYGFIFDLNHLRYAFHQGRDTKLEQNIENPDTDGQEELYKSDVGLHFELEGSHAMLKGLSA